MATPAGRGSGPAGPGSGPAAAPAACPACGASGGLAFLEAYHDPVGPGDYRLYRCPACEVVFADPFEHPGSAWYERFSSSDSYECTGQWRFGWFFSLGLPPGRLLDVGCGAGHFLEHARRAGFDAVGVDPNPQAVGGAKARGLSIEQGGIEHAARRHPSGSFDVVTLFEVFEHVENPAGTLKLARGLLRPGGSLVVTTPNDLRPVPFGRDSFDYPPHHLTRWTPRALERFVAAQGFTIVAGHHAYFPTWEFSRLLVGRATAAALELAKRLLYGRPAADATLTKLIDAQLRSGAPPGLKGRLLGLIRDKSTRTRIVAAFQAVLGAALAPAFFPVKLYYLWTIPGVGVSNCIHARKA